jgi:hypothetical protein
MKTENINKPHHSQKYLKEEELVTSKNINKLNKNKTLMVEIPTN